MINVILCGGNGTRLWPLSRELYPKQFYKLFDNESLFQKTIKRNKVLCDKALIISNENQYFLALDQLEEMNEQNVRFMLEPVGRNTAPAIALACFSLPEDEMVLITPSDHFIEEKEDEYEKAIYKALEIAEKNKIVIFGIKPTYPETNFGYIESNGEDVLAFKEKPDINTAMKFFKQGNFFWNSGMFVFKAGVFLQELSKYSPEIYELCKVAFQEARGQAVKRIPIDAMQNIPSDSIDCAVIEKSKNVKVVLSKFNWSDLGSFEAIDDQLPKTKDGNTKNSNNIYLNSNNNLVMSKERFIATIDVNDLVIIETGDALLIAKKGSSQKVKEVVNMLNDNQSSLTKKHLTVYRPWGNSTFLDESEHYKIKKVIVKPGTKLTKQKHYHRNEHWVVVSGTAKVTIGQKEFILRTNESTYIPMGEEHLVENPGKINLVFIEVQVGPYLEDDDIIRL
ncbi:mannose-1-phosphate guanylyltransferase/mannose-6-phosphate isomerase [Paenibacillus tyrfis]|uniref:mannose-1-phosphate guanylyltransferase n=1 Tax=Paenibacillus tyrfis TaxID=1501230 RepID=A0A081PB76_9BACL|nr:mannose-1-phosphate guanylyltransferase/mannose-6-phosphate isomerase [Paenibacillus tyrfis]KEQ27949.1 mannose-6-phosphate isomerase [Paenibacillus tyrfis]